VVAATPLYALLFIFELFVPFCGYSFFLGSLRPFIEIPGSLRDQSGGADKAGDTDG
jgi:hypothetical protein